MKNKLGLVMVLAVVAIAFSCTPKKAAEESTATADTTTMKADTTVKAAVDTVKAK